ncbi:disulfide isomerase [Aliidiomarina shirensis]|uniref:Thiol:disulfide interchange protein n=1 Tax=Aliidiomarina shirensis TaxID=1048642 RepID=A0A432WNW8_9GAMM|nr:DsbA family protein [Aliidiomarina shirensis]RUO35451.1 disulfide isomerase [Aliidiomarina shirensis]
MKKLVVALFVFVFVALAPAQAQEFEEGVHYRVVSDTVSRNPEIIDFFSFYCNGCYQYAPFSDMLKAEFGDAFQKYHVNLVVPNAAIRDNIQAIWATAIMLGVDEQFKERMFQKHFVRNDFTNSVAEAKQVMLDLGVEEETYNRAFGSMQVRGLSNRMNSLQREFAISRTPTYIVNRKYEMLPGGFNDSANFFDDYLKLAAYLLEKR